MILFLADKGHIYSMAPGDTLYFESVMVTSPVDSSWIELRITRPDGTEMTLMILDDDEAEEFEHLLVACLEAGKNDHTLLVDLEGLRVLAKGKG